jgi:hypothetical protein
MPNHCSVTKNEAINMPLGGCRILTLDTDNGTASSGIIGTHEEYLAAITIKGKAIFMISFTKNGKQLETKREFIRLLETLRIK